MSLPASLAYASQKLADFETNSVKVYPNGDIQRYQDGQIIEFTLPQTIVDLDSIFVSFMAGVQESVGDKIGRLPEDIHSLIDRINIKCGSLTLDDGFRGWSQFMKKYNRLIGKKTNPLSNPHIARKQLKPYIPDGVVANPGLYGVADDRSQTVAETGSAHFIWSDFTKTFIGTAMPRILDLSIMPPMMVSFHLAREVCVRGLAIDTTSQDPISKFVAKDPEVALSLGGINVSEAPYNTTTIPFEILDPVMNVNVISFNSTVYDSMVSSTMGAGALVVPFKKVYSYTDRHFLNLTDFNVATKSLDRIHWQPGHKKYRGGAIFSPMRRQANNLDYRDSTAPPPVSGFKFKLESFARPAGSSGGATLGYNSPAVPVAISAANTEFIEAASGSIGPVPEGALFKVTASDKQPLIVAKYERSGSFTGGVGIGSIFGGGAVEISASVTTFAAGTAQEGKVGSGAILSILQETSSDDKVQQVQIVKAGTGFCAGNTITLDIKNDPVMGASSPNCTPLVFTITDAMLQSNLTSIEVTSAGKGFVPGDIVKLKLSAQITGATDYSFTVANSMLEAITFDEAEDDAPNAGIDFDPNANPQSTNASFLQVANENGRLAFEESYLDPRFITSFTGAGQAATPTAISYQVTVNNTQRPQYKANVGEIYRLSQAAVSEEMAPGHQQPLSEWTYEDTHCVVRFNRPGSTVRDPSGLDTVNTSAFCTLIGDNLPEETNMDIFCETTACLYCYSGQSVSLVN